MTNLMDTDRNADGFSSKWYLGAILTHLNSTFTSNRHYCRHPIRMFEVFWVSARFTVAGEALACGVFFARIRRFDDLPGRQVGWKRWRPTASCKAWNRGQDAEAEDTQGVVQTRESDRAG